MRIRIFTLCTEFAYHKGCLSFKTASFWNATDIQTLRQFLLLFVFIYSLGLLVQVSTITKMLWMLIFFSVKKQYQNRLVCCTKWLFAAFWDVRKFGINPNKCKSRSGVHISMLIMQDLNLDLIIFRCVLEMKQWPIIICPIHTWPIKFCLQTNFNRSVVCWHILVGQCFISRDLWTSELFISQYVMMYVFLAFDLSKEYDVSIGHAITAFFLRSKSKRRLLRKPARSKRINMIFVCSVCISIMRVF